jgi:methyl-accepting chemotaxis protein
MKDLSIGARLQAMTAVAIFSLLMLAGSGVYVTQALRTSAGYVYENTLPSVVSLDVIGDRFLRIRLAALMHALQKDTAKKGVYELQIRELKDEVKQKQADYEKNFVSDAKDKELLDSQKKLFETYMAEIEPVLDRSRAGDEAGMAEALARVQANAQHLLEVIEAHKKFNVELGEQSIRNAEESNRRLNALGALLIVLSLATVGSLSFFVIRDIRHRMSALSKLINHVSESLDFTARLEVRRKSPRHPDNLQRRRSNRRKRLPAWRPPSNR